MGELGESNLQLKVVDAETGKEVQIVCCDLEEPPEILSMGYNAPESDLQALRELDYTGAFRVQLSGRKYKTKKARVRKKHLNQWLRYLGIK